MQVCTLASYSSGEETKTFCAGIWHILDEGIPEHTLETLMLRLAKSQKENRV